jgi:hypothetical protein
MVRVTSFPRMMLHAVGFCLALLLLTAEKLLALRQAMLSMFELTTGDNWPDTMHQAMDITAVDQQPVINHSSQNALYFVAFFLMVKVFIGVFMKEVRL